MIDVSDLTEQDLAYIVAATSVTAVAADTGLPVAYLGLLVADRTPAGEHEVVGCPACGWSCTTRYRPDQRCRYCGRAVRNEHISQARNVLACGLDGDLALNALEDAGHPYSRARKLLTAARKHA